MAGAPWHAVVSAEAAACRLIRQPRKHSAVAYSSTGGACFACEYSTEHDEEAEIREMSAVFPQEKSEDRQAKKSGHLQDKSCGGETGEGSAVL